jgi:hypothetical protein
MRVTLVHLKTGHSMGGHLALELTVNHLLGYVIPAARDYYDAEMALTKAFAATNYDKSQCRTECETAKRRASEVAVAIDGLADRAATALGSSTNKIRKQVAVLSSIDGSVRHGCVDRVCAVANAYKHDVLDDKKHPIRSAGDVLVVGAFGIDGYGMGKFAGIGVLVKQSNGKQRKFLADVPYTIAGWYAFLRQQGASLPNDTITICGLRVN